MFAEAIEFTGYFSFFWLFVFNPRFRHVRINEWHEGSWMERGFMLLEAVSSTLIGLVLPVAILCWLVV